MASHQVHLTADAPLSRDLLHIAGHLLPIAGHPLPIAGHLLPMADVPDLPEADIELIPNQNNHYVLIPNQNHHHYVLFL